MMRDNLGWLLVDATRGQAALVDGTDAGSVLAYCEAIDVILTTIINTHTHPDHIGVNRDLQRQGLLAEMRVIGPCPTTTPTPVPGLTEVVGEGDKFSFGDAEFTTLRTDGHLDGHVCYLVAGAVFCGDILFGCGCGRVFSGPPEKLYASLQRLAGLPPETLVYCAHEYTAANIAFAKTLDPDNQALCAREASVAHIRGAGGCTIPTTVGIELATNPFLRTDTRPIREAVARALPAEPATTAAEVFAAARLLRNGFKQVGV